jgi:hypothetical protein
MDGHDLSPVNHITGATDGVRVDNHQNSDRDNNQSIHVESDWGIEILSRLTAIEQRLSSSELHNSTMVRSQATNMPESQYQLSTSPKRSNEGSALFSNEEEALDMDHASPNLQGGTDLLTPITMLDRIVGPFEAGQQPKGIQHSHQAGASECHFTGCKGFPDCCTGDLQMWTEIKRYQDVENLRASFQTFFSCLNPHCKSSIMLTNI